MTPRQSTQSDPKRTRAWVVAASQAPIAAVILRCNTGKQWTGFFRWNWQIGSLDAGAWTTMRVRAHRCQLSADAEFLLYQAAGSRHTPFSNTLGVSYAVSRLPWIAALTHPQSFGPAGGMVSRDALSEPEQERLWSHFPPENFVHSGDLAEQLGHGWQAIERPVPNEPNSRQSAAITVSDDLSLRACVDVASMSVWLTPIRFELIRRDRPVAVDLSGIRWAYPDRRGGLLILRDDAVIQRCDISFHSAESAALLVQHQHDLRQVVPTPGPAPAWAKAPLRDYDADENIEA